MPLETQVLDLGLEPSIEELESIEAEAALPSQQELARTMIRELGITQTPIPLKINGVTYERPDLIELNAKIFPELTEQRIRKYKLPLFRHPGLDRSFMKKALCKGTDPELFMVDEGESASDAKAMCARCIVRSQCLEYGIESKEEGIYGGTTKRERNRIVRQRRRAANKVSVAA